ncbi:PAS domain S-box protein [Candidatus Poribacteria bacterium]|nr:PAS domain S-box protein [Candidatus Poribacteria bacterium]
MSKIKTLRDAKGYKDLETRPTTTRDVMGRQVPLHTVQNIRRGHLVRGMRDINRIQWEEWEQKVVETLREVERQRFDRSNRFYNALGRIHTLLKALRGREEELQTTVEEVEAANEELQATAEEVEVANEKLQATNEELQTITKELEHIGAYRKTLMDSMQDILMTTDTSGVITDVNRAAERISGYSREELIGQPFRQFFADSERAQADIEQVLAEEGVSNEGGVSNYDLTLVAKDGRQVLVSYNATVLRDPEGHITGVLGTARNITRQVKATQALQDSEKRIRAIVETVVDGIFSISERGIVELLNPTAERLFGYAADEVIGQNIKMLMPEPYSSEHDSYLANYLSTGEKKIIGIGRQVVGRRKDGTLFPMDLAVGEVLLNNRRMFIGTARDVTKQVQADEQIQKMHAELEQQVEMRTVELEHSGKALAARNRDLETLLHVISHDLREPLRAIENFSRLVNERYAERLDEKGQDFLSRVSQGVTRLNHLLNDILMLSRVQRMEMPSEVVEGEEIVREALERLSDMIKNTNAEVRVATNLPQLRVDKTWATQAVYNLIANALKFTRKDATPEVEIAPYQPAPGDPEGVGFVVRDRGPGVPPEHAERIFKLFQRAVGREVEGTGAGLAIVQQVAERHGGSAWVRQREGSGSEFIITFRKLEISGEDKK